MNMKKLMAVVLAVVLAISAMAINVFAAEGTIEKIPLRPFDARTYDSTTVTYTFEAPVYGMFGFINQNNYLELNLPTKPTTFWNTDGVSLQWYITTNLGNKVKITPEYKANAVDPEHADTDPNDPNEAYTTVYVDFGAYERDYVKLGDTEVWALLRQGTFGEITTLTLVAEVKVPGYDNQWWNPSTDPNDGKLKNYDMKMQLWTAGVDGMKTYGDKTVDEEVTGSVLYSANMIRNKSNSTAYDASVAVFDFTSSRAEGGQQVELTWDMTLQNRYKVMNAESARVVIKLANVGGKTGAKGFTNGIALYSLYMKDTATNPGSIGQIWWGNQYKREENRVSFMSVDTTMGNVTELVFDVPVEKLYDTTYGVPEYGIAAMTSTFKVYVESEVTSGLWDSWTRNYDHWTEDAYLELTMPAVDGSTEIEAPVPVESNEGGDTIDAGEDEPAGDVNVEEPTEEPEDTNPPTGIVLAVLPMVVAAAAVVASKRR